MKILSTSEMISSSSFKYSYLTEEVLLQDTLKASREEKACTMVLLEYLLEVDRRRTYASLGFSSLFEYVHRELKYSESQTSERVNAVRLMRGSDTVKEHLRSGELTLTSASQIQRFFRTEKKVSSAIPEAKKQAVIEACLNRSKREVEQVLFAQASEPTKLALKERITPIDPHHLELKLTINLETESKLKRAKEVTTHESLADLLDKALTALIEKQEKKMGRVNSKTESVSEVPVTRIETLPTTLPAMFEQDENSTENQDRSSTLPATLEKKLTPPLKLNDPTLPATQPNHSSIELKSDSPQMPQTEKPSVSTIKTPSTSRYIPTSYKRILYQRSQGQCEFIHSQTHERCQSHHHLHIDHIQPLALQGTTTPQNLRHLCSAHNQKAAQRVGLKK